MAIVNGQQGSAADFIAASDGTAGKVPKTNVGGKLDISFLPQKNALTLVPNAPGSFSTSTIQITTSTVIVLGLLNVQTPILLSSITIIIQTATTPDTVDFTLYTEDGSTQIFSETSSSISTTGAQTITLASPVSLDAGNYYFGVNLNTPGNLNFVSHNIASASVNSPSGKPVIAGTLTISAGTPPASFDPTALSAALNRSVFVRFNA